MTTFLELFTTSNIKTQPTKLKSSANVWSFDVAHEDWLKVLELAYNNQWRFAGLWCANNTDKNHIDNITSALPIPLLQLTLCCVANEGYVLIQTNLSYEQPEILSATNFYPASNRFERYIHDMYSINFINSSDQRRWIRHQAWNEEVFPLHPKDADKIDAMTTTTQCKHQQPNKLPYQQQLSSLTSSDCNYPFAKLDGMGICEVPVGPVHAGIIEPGHFRFSVNGEDILHLEERLGYVHKGVEKLAENKNIDELLRLASRVSGDSTVAYAWSLCRACEDSVNISLPQRALYLRAIMLERERIANHLGDMGALCNDVGFAFAYYQFGRLREIWQRTNLKIFQHRFMMDNIVFGSVKHDMQQHDITAMQEEIIWLQKELTELLAIIYNNSSLQDRFVTTGILTQEYAKKFGVLGFVAKASGIDFDIRTNFSHAPYSDLDVKIKKIVFTESDVAKRFEVRAEETLNSCEILANLLHKLSQDNSMLLDLNLQEKQTLLANHQGFGFIEGWRGEILTYVKFNAQGLTERYFVRDPSWFNWLALEELVHNNITPDFPVCNKSVNGSYSGVDL